MAQVPRVLLHAVEARSAWLLCLQLRLWRRGAVRTTGLQFAERPGQVVRVRLHARHAHVATTAAVGGDMKVLALVQVLL